MSKQYYKAQVLSEKDGSVTRTYYIEDDATEGTRRILTISGESPEMEGSEKYFDSLSKIMHMASDDTVRINSCKKNELPYPVMKEWKIDPEITESETKVNLKIKGYEFDATVKWMEKLYHKVGRGAECLYGYFFDIMFSDVAWEGISALINDGCDELDIVGDDFSIKVYSPTVSSSSTAYKTDGRSIVKRFTTRHINFQFEL